MQDAISEIRTLLERFANGQSMSVIFDAFNALADDANRDEGLRDWFKSVDAYIRKVGTQFLFIFGQLDSDVLGLPPCRSCSNQAMYWSRTTTLSCVTLDVNSTTSIKATLTTCLTVLIGGSRLWAKTP